MSSRMNYIQIFLVFVFCYAVCTYGKRLRLPMLMRIIQIDCNFTTNECGINQNLDEFTLEQNSSLRIAGRNEFYLFSIEDYLTPHHEAKLKTIYFPSLDSSHGCLHVEYNVQGANSFLFMIDQKSQSTLPKNIFTQSVLPYSNWKTADVNFTISDDDFMFVFEVMCQWCLRGSKFSISRIVLTWNQCQT